MWAASVKHRIMQDNLSTIYFHVTQAVKTNNKLHIKLHKAKKVNCNIRKNYSSKQTNEKLTSNVDSVIWQTDYV